MTENRTEIPGGFISFSKKVEDKEIHLTFKAQLPINFSAEKIWEQLDFGFTGRKPSWLWSAQSSTSKAISLPLKSGDNIRTTYFFKSKKNPSAPLKKSTYTYKMLRWEPEVYTLQYHAEDDHPFNGGATVRLEPTSKSTCNLHWDGLYIIGSKMEKIADHFGSYFPISMRGFQHAAPP